MTQDELKSRLRYDPETGLFTWLHNPDAPLRWNNRYPGTKAGSKMALDYFLISINKKRYYAHRLAYLYVYGEMPEEIDHIDGDPANNAIANLRRADRKINTKNLKINCRNASGKMGVAWDQNRNRWAAWISINGKQAFRKRFLNREDAESHRNALEKKYEYHENHGRR